MKNCARAYISYIYLQLRQIEREREREREKAKKFPDIIFHIQPRRVIRSHHGPHAQRCRGGGEKAGRGWQFLFYSTLYEPIRPRLRKEPRRPHEGRFNIRLWRLCFTVWDTRPHSAPSSSIVRLIYVFSRVIRSPCSPSITLPLPSLPHPLAAVPVEEGRSPWQRRASRRPIVGRLRRGSTRRTRTIIIDREGKGAIGVVKGMCESVVCTAQRGC